MSQGSSYGLQHAIEAVNGEQSTLRTWMTEYLEEALAGEATIEVRMDDEEPAAGVRIMVLEGYALYAPATAIPEWVSTERDLPLEVQ